MNKITTYKFLTKKQLSEIDKFVNDTFGTFDIKKDGIKKDGIKKDGVNKVFSKDICDNPKISLCFYDGNIFIVKDTCIISKIGLQNYNNEYALEVFLKKNLNDIQKQCIQKKFDDRRAICENHNIQKKQLKLQLFKVDKDNYKKKIKDQERQKQNEFYSNYAEIIKQNNNRIKPFYKVRGYFLDYKKRLKNHKVKCIKQIDLPNKQFENIKNLKNAKKLKNNRMY